MAVKGEMKTLLGGHTWEVPRQGMSLVPREKTPVPGRFGVLILRCGGRHNGL